MAYCKANQLDCNGFCNRFDAPCIKKNCRFFGVKTNADRIRAMDDETLTDQLTQVFIEGVQAAMGGLEVPDKILDEIRSNILKKLQQPAEGE